MSLGRSAQQASQLPSLRRSVLAVVAGNLIYTASQFVMIVAVARLTDTVEVGRYALGLAITAPIFVFAGLKLRHVQAVDAAGFNEPREFFGLRIVTSAAALAVIALAVFAIDISRETAFVVLAVALFKAVEAQVDVHYGVLQRHEHMTAIALSQAARGLCGLVVFVGVLWQTDRVAIAALALAAYTLLPVLTTGLAVRRLGVSLRPSFTLGALGRLTWLAMPLGVSVAIGSLIVNVPRYQLQHLTGASELGVFAVLAYALVATNTVATALSDGAAPRMANQFVAGDNAGFRHVLHRLMLGGLILGIVGVVGAAVLGRPFLDLVFGPEYSAEWFVLVVLMTGATAQYVALSLGTAVNAMRLFRVQVPINVVELMVVALGCTLLIPRFGLVGAAVAIALAQALQALMYAGVYFLRVRPALDSRSDTVVG